MDEHTTSQVSQALAAAAVARRLAVRGDVHLALALLCQAVRLAPEAPVLESAEKWLTPDRLRALGRRPLRRLAFTMAHLAAALTVRSGGGHLPNLRAGARLLARGRALYPDEGKLYISEAFVCDKLGDQVGKAVVARDAAGRMPRSWTGHGVMHALSSRVPVAS